MCLCQHADTKFLILHILSTLIQLEIVTITKPARQNLQTVFPKV